MFGVCDYAGCSDGVSLDTGCCKACLAEYCPQHIGLDNSTTHSCPSRTQLRRDEGHFAAFHDRRYLEIKRLLALLEGVDSAIEAKRPGVAFTFDIPEPYEPQTWLYGCFHLHVPVNFADGVNWLVSFRVSLETRIAEKTSFALTATEVASAQTVHQLAPDFAPKMITPEGFDCRSKKDSAKALDHRLPFVFVERVQGRTPEVIPGETQDVIDVKFRRTVKGLALMMSQMSARSFTGVGSLTLDGEGEVVVGPVQTVHSACCPSDALGVYRTSAEFKVAQLQLNMRLVREQRQWWDWRWATVRAQFDPVWAYIMYLEGLDIVRSHEALHVEQPTYLRHCDDHKSQYLVKDDGSLAGVLDWEFSMTLPFAEAFISPSWLRFDDNQRKLRTRRDNGLKFDEQALYEELLALGREDLAEAVWDGYKYHRLNNLVRGRPPYYEGAVGLRLAFSPNAHIPASKEEWVEEALVRYADDEGLQQVVAEHKQYLKENGEAFDNFFRKEWGRPVGPVEGDGSADLAYIHPGGDKDGEGSDQVVSDETELGDAELDGPESDEAKPDH